MRLEVPCFRYFQSPFIFFDDRAWSQFGELRTRPQARKDASAPDPLLVELVKLLARAAAERDYIRLCRKDSEGKQTGRRGE